ncbi:MAG: tripartite tricarboxylate transporter substrate binding protein [Proteobacteria bacterium]|nr:tripartite tricarboxylate transporter substrate binding protein [Pseudomonadota bacterium]
MKSAALVCLALAAGAPFAAIAQEFPVRPLRLIIPYPPGGGTDLIGRIVAKRVGDRLGQTVVVDNRAGGNGAIGAAAAASGAPDGHTLLMIISTHTVLPSLQKLSYDLVKDFTAVTHIADLPNVLGVRNALPVTSVAELIALARKNPGQLTYAGAGLGGPSHLWAALFNHMTGTRMLHVPYKGTGPATIDLLGGQVDLMFSTSPGIIPHMRSGKLRALAVTDSKRSPALPELPTIDEAGVKGYVFVSWYGMVVRAGTPVRIVDRLHAENTAVLQMPEVRQLLEDQGGQITGRGPAEFAAYLRTEIKRWAEIIAVTQIKAE